MLKFAGSFRFASPGAIAPGVIDDYFDLINRVSTQGDRQTFLEHFKRYFGNAAGIPSSRSSNAGWAESDLRTSMRAAAENAPLFIEAFYDACMALQSGNPELATPHSEMMNAILAKHGAGYSIRPPDLITSNQRANRCNGEAKLPRRTSTRDNTAIAETIRRPPDPRSRPSGGSRNSVAFGDGIDCISRAGSWAGYDTGKIL